VELHSKGRIQALPSNVRVGYKCLEVTMTLALYIKVLTTTLKSFIVQAPQLSYSLGYVRGHLAGKWQTTIGFLVSVIP